MWGPWLVWGGIALLVMLDMGVLSSVKVNLWRKRG